MLGRKGESLSFTSWAAGAFATAAVFCIGSTDAEAQTRSLKLKNVHTNESAEVTYMRNGRIDPAGMKKANYILRDWRKNQPTQMNPKTLDILWNVYKNTGASGYIHIICGYRSPATNSMLRSRSKGVAKKSQHMLGNAIDYYIPGVKLKTLRNAGLALQAGGVGYYPSSGSPFVHMDIGRVRTWGGPGISETEMASILRNGKKMSSGSYTVAAYSGGGKSRGLLSRLFGGGADEEEDNAEAGVTTAKTKPAKTVKSLPGVEAGEVPVAKASKKKQDSEVVPPELASPAKKPGIEIVPPELATPARVPLSEEQSVEPVEVVETPETIIAALPSRKVPLPGFAPRPQVDVAEPVEVAAAEPTPSAPVAAASAVDVAAAIEQPETAITEEPKQEVALGIPLPTWRPQYKPAAAPEADATALLAMASAKVESDADAAFPVPAARPATAKQGRVAKAAQPTPTQVASLEAMAAETVEVSAPVPVAAPTRTTAKTGRVTKSAPAAKSVPVVKTAPAAQAVAAAKPEVTQPAASRWAVNKTFVAKSTKGTKAPSFAYNVVRTAPMEVYTAGFQQGSQEGAVNRFSGEAVKFLKTSRFTQN